MPTFDFAFNLRDSLAGATDPEYAAAVLSGEVYPHTYVNGNGLTFTAGHNAGLNTYDFANGNDPRLLGMHYSADNHNFRMDLTSGSCPGPGTYRLDIAFGGHAFGTPKTAIEVLDDGAILVLDLTNGSNGFVASTANRFFDATGTERTAAVWNGSTVSLTFTGSIVVLNLYGPLPQPDFFALNHLRLTQIVPTETVTVTLAGIA